MEINDSHSGFRQTEISVTKKLQATIQKWKIKQQTTTFEAIFSISRQNRSHTCNPHRFPSSKPTPHNQKTQKTKKLQKVTKLSPQPTNMPF